MNFLDHTMIWAKGEAFEMSLLVAAGTLILTFAGLLWRFASTPVAQALPIPMVVVALIFVVSGLSNLVTAPGKLAQYSETYEQTPTGFVQSEKSRVEKFESLYTYTIIGAAVAFTVALALFTLSEIPILRAIAVALVFLGFSGLVIDMFSKERAATYKQAIDSEIKQLNEATRKIDDLPESPPGQTKS